MVLGEITKPGLFLFQVTSHTIKLVFFQSQKDEMGQINEQV